MAENDIVDGNGKNQSIDLTKNVPGIDWLGWKYIEADIPESFTGPFKIHSTQAVRLMSTKSGIAGPMTKGSIYIDNIRAVYGDKVDDLNPPVIQSLNVEGKEYTTNAVNLTAKVNEYEDDPFKTGIDWDKISIFVDGKDYSKAEGHFSYDMDGSVSLSGLKWADGTHKVVLMIPDKFGNQGIKTGYFKVNTGSAKMEIVQKQDQAYLGDVLDLVVKATNPADLSSSNLKIQIDKNYPVKDVKFSNGFVNSTSSYDEETGILTLNLVNSSEIATMARLVNSGETAATAELATIHIDIPAFTKEDSQLTYEILDASLTYVNPKEENFISTFSMERASAAIKGAYNLTFEPVLIGKPAVMTVKNTNDELMSDAEVFAVIGNSKDPVLLGKTDSKGTLVVDSITNEVEKVSLYVVKDGKYSFKVNTQTYPALVNATEMKNVISTPTSDPYKTKSFTWMSSPLAKEKSAVVQYAKKAMYDKNGDASLQTVTGTSTNQVFSGDQDIKKNGMIRMNEVTLTELQQDTTYVYRVGDGTNWSDMQEFTILKKKKTFEFAVLGDTQSPADLSLFNTILSDLNKKDLAFMIHVGDLIDESAKFNQWNDVLSTIGKHENIASTDLVAALGNHEYMGDEDGHLAKSIFNAPENGPDADKGGTYSVDYNNIHISVLGYTDDSKVLDKQLEWLKQDMKKSKQPWKILVTHKPPYFTNPFGGNAIMKEKLPPVADELGIDIVFSGHDHSYGRTKQLKDGKEDTNGTVYVVAGTTGQKHYDAVTDEKFAYVNMENIAVSMRAQVNNNQIMFTTVTSDGKIIDQFTVTNEKYDEEE